MSMSQSTYLTTKMAKLTVACEQLVNLRAYLIYCGIPRDCTNRYVPLGRAQTLCEIIGRTNSSLGAGYREAVKTAVVSFLNPQEVIIGTYD